MNYRIYLLHSCWCIAFGWLNSNSHLNSIACALFNLFKPFILLSLSLPLSGLIFVAARQLEVRRCTSFSLACFTAWQPSSAARPS
jgi:hypothetical protein